METTEEITEVGLNDFTYGDRELGAWETEFTVIIPRQPCHMQEIQNCITDLNNKYQLAYNCVAELQVVCSSKNRTLFAVKNQVIAAKSAEYRASGAKPPAKDILESIALATPECRALAEDASMCELIFEFFNSHKTKLEKSMQLCISLLYSVKGNDKMHDTGAR
jgi:hypothetical protein